MTDEELTLLLSDMESDRVERKESANDGEKIRQAICAFANDLPGHNQPGVVFVGITDDGHSSGLSITDTLLLNLASMRSDGNILPFPSLQVQKRTLLGNEVAVIIIQPSDTPPVRYKGVVWIRVGPRRATASAQEERQLTEKRRFKDLPFDVRPAVGLTSDILDEIFFRSTYLPAAVDSEVLIQNQRTFEHQLLALRFAHPGPPVCPTTLGILVVGKAPSEHIPCAYVQFLRIDGQLLTDPIKSSKEIRGNIAQIISSLDELFKVHISTASSITTEDIEKRIPDYPIVALQQLVRNAIMHRTYESTNAPIRVTWFNDRIEIQNPGGPFGIVNRSNFGAPGATDYRNPHLAEALKNLGYVQRFGVGIALAKKELALNGNPPPEFLVEDSHVAVILRRRA